VNRWDLILLLDVIEHIPDPLEVIRQARSALRPGGLVLITAPAMPRLSSRNDELALHQRRYRLSDFSTLADQGGFILRTCNYFMGTLSPLYILTRALFRPPHSPPTQQIQAHLAKTHRAPSAPVNQLLYAVLRIETALIGRRAPPFGTSILDVFQRPT
jgi:SAM-dependent methyltransferase